MAGIAAIPYLLFTTINYVDYPLGSGNDLQDSAFCALLDINITPQVKPNKTMILENSITRKPYGFSIFIIGVRKV